MAIVQDNLCHPYILSTTVLSDDMGVGRVSCLEFSA
jgi:hypothetical protein